MQSERKVCKKCNNSFLIESEDFAFYERMQVPPPTHCPMCRLKRRMMFRNFRTLYKRKSDKTGESIISMYHKDAPFPVWSRDEWYSDDWDAISFGREYDFTKSFFEQYKELNDKVPRFALMINNSPGCLYSNLCHRSLNCYFAFGSVDNEYIDYSHSVWNSKESIDCLYLFKSEYCYECIDVTECSRMLYSEECISCTDSIGLFNCRNCLNCIGCVGLRNKSYYIFNQQVSKEEYQKFLDTHPVSEPQNVEYILSKQRELRNKVPTPHMFGAQNSGVSGNHVFQSKNVKESFDVKSGENSKYGYTIRKMVDSYDCNFALDIESCYEMLFSLPSNIKFSHLCIDSSYVEYSEFCLNSNNIFGCVGLRKKDYCILNKQYSKEEYEILLPKIINHMKSIGEYGEFFPANIAPFAYNESTVGEYHPLTKNEALNSGYAWRDDIPYTTGQENCVIIDIEPDSVYDFEYLKDKVFSCHACSRNYRFIEHEVMFYKRFKLSLPMQCFFCRHDKRMKHRKERVLYDGVCACTKEGHDHGSSSCSIKFKTVYNQQDSELLFCEKCYQQEMY